VFIGVNVGVCVGMSVGVCVCVGVCCCVLVCACCSVCVVCVRQYERRTYACRLCVPRTYTHMYTEWVKNRITKLHNTKLSLLCTVRTDVITRVPSCIAARPGHSEL
jgi:hypothetical protein